MRLYEVLRHYDLSLRHNPKHFYPNSFQVEMEANGRVVLVAVVKRHVGKRFRVVGILRERERDRHA